MGPAGGFTTRGQAAGRSADIQRVNLERCPYDGSAVEVDSYSGGSFMLTCRTCGAAWEVHNVLTRRVAEPDWDAARRHRGRAAITDAPPVPAGPEGTTDR